MTDYHELPEVPKCCATCRWFDADIYSEIRIDGHCHADPTVTPIPEVALHGLCSHWERRDDGG